MAQLLVRQLDDATIDRLTARACAAETSVETLARQAINDAARLTVAEKLAVVERLRAWGEAAKVPGVAQTPGVDLIREDRDR